MTYNVFGGTLSLTQSVNLPSPTCNTPPICRMLIPMHVIFQARPAVGGSTNAINCQLASELKRKASEKLRNCDDDRVTVFDSVVITSWYY